MPSAPVVPKRPVTRELFGEVLVDDYAWLRERDDPEVQALLEAENLHAEAVLRERSGELREQLFVEMRGRVREDDSSVPARHGPWLYYTRIEVGDEYPRHCRRRVEGERACEQLPEQLYLDENSLAEAHDYFDLAALAISPDHRWCAFVFDADGDEVYELRILDLDSGELTPTRVRGCGRSLAWVSSEVLLYTTLDDIHRPWQVRRRHLDRPSDEDPVIWSEADGKFYISLYRTRSDAFVVITSDSAITSEVWLLPTATPEAEPWCVAPRREGIEYGVTHRGEHLYVLTNEDAQNFAIDLVALDGGQRRRLIAQRDHVLIEDIDLFADYLIAWERCDGLPRIRVLPITTLPERAGDDEHPAPGEHLIAFAESAYSVWADSNLEFDSTTLRFAYGSMTTPDSIFDYDLRTRERVLLKRSVVVGGHEPSRYRSVRIWAPAPDGERVPISLVWRAFEPEQPRPTGPRPLVLDGYGAYGVTQDPSFSSARLSLLDRGAIFAVAHVRGGGSLGRRWYESGKFEHKPNTFTDFIACAEFLIAEGWTSVERLAAVGDSAGGLLIGAVANMRPELFTAMVAHVPFVDVLNTMLDPSLPLSLIERDEWGDPNTPEGFAWIRPYCPYENVRAQAYPDMLVLAGYNDTRVGYWEAAKWVARLRERKTDSRDILLWIDMNVGHAGASGRFEYLAELALEYAFLLERLGLIGADEASSG